MCVLTIAVEKKPSLEMLRKMSNLNCDGFGIAWFFKGSAHFKKGITDVNLMYDFTQRLSLPYVLHARLASHGGKDNLLTHPFIVGENSPLVTEGEGEKLLFHNGTFADWRVCLKASGIYYDEKEPMSDTRALSMIIRNGNERFLHSIGGKFVLVDASKEKFFMYGGLDWDEEEGMWFSNKYWKYRGNCNYHHDYHSYSNEYGSHEWVDGKWVWVRKNETREFREENSKYDSLATYMGKKERRRYLKNLNKREPLNPIGVTFQLEKPLDIRDEIETENYSEEFMC